MPNFAIVENGIVTNTILADSKAIAEEVTGKTCVAYTTEPAEIGGTYVNKKFIKRKPYPSWVSDGDVDWKAPVDYPTVDPENPKHYIWDEATTSWVEAHTE
jgi:hypothetical protein